MFTVSLNRVRDEIAIQEGEERLILSVDSDANTLVRRLVKAKTLMDAVTADTTDEERVVAAKTFASAIFGEEQAEKIIAFYKGNAANVAEVCGQYFERRLADKITKVQIKAGKHDIRAWKRKLVK